MIDHALAWAKRGFRVFPLSEGGKRPVRIGWQGEATSDPEMIRKLWGSREYNIGVLATGIIVDVDNKNGKSGSAEWELFGFPDDTLTVETPSGGFHLYYRSDEAGGQPNLTDAINIRAAGLGYVLAPGSLIDGKPYTLVRDVAVLDAPQRLVEHCRRLGPTNRDAIGEQDTDENIQRAIEFLEAREPAVEGQNGDLWTYVTACKVIDLGVSADMCHELMAEHWNDRCSPPWELEGPGSLQEKTDSAYRNRLMPPGSSSPEAEFGGVDIPAPQAKPKTRPRVMWAGDPNLDLSQQWLMYNRFPRIGTAMLVGPSGGGKTFLSLDLAVALASEREWLGRQGDERVGAIILSAEGIGGLPARMKPLPNVPVVATTVGLLADEAKGTIETLTALRDEIRTRFDVRLGLIVLDTMTAAGLLANENDNSEIGRAIKVLENMARMFECLVLVTHHPPKNGTGARGGYALHAGFDTIVEIFQERNRRERFVECTKGRDAPVGAWGSFVLEPYTVEPDLSGRGRDVTTQRVVFGAEQRNPVSGRAPAENRVQKFLGAFEDIRFDLKLEPKVTPIPLEKLRERYVELTKSWSGDPEKSFKEVLSFTRHNKQVTIIEEDTGTSIVEMLG